MIISISKIKNRTARRKNRREKGRRALDDGENPHSNGLVSSRSFHGLVDDMLISENISLSSSGRVVASVRGIIIVIIVYVWSSGRLYRKAIITKMEK